MAENHISTEGQAEISNELVDQSDDGEDEIPNELVGHAGDGEAETSAEQVDQTEDGEAETSTEQVDQAEDGEAETSTEQVGRAEDGEAESSTEQVDQAEGGEGQMSNGLVDQAGEDGEMSNELVDQDGEISSDLVDQAGEEGEISSELVDQAGEEGEISSELVDQAGEDGGISNELVDQDGDGNIEEGDEKDSSKDENVLKLMQNIFGDDEMSDDEIEGPSERKVEYADEDEPKLIRVEEDEEDDNLGRRWDFDVMLDKKKVERKRRRRKDGSIDLMADADDQIRLLVDGMNEAANEDRVSNMDRRPAVRKRKMLHIVKSALLKADLFEAMLDNGMISALSEWLAPLPDKSLPALEIRCTLLKILESWPNLEQGILKQSGLGRAVMYLFKHPKETKENKLIAAKLIREWSRPIFQLDSDFRSLSKEERVQRDFSQMPLAKRRRLSMEDDGMHIFSSSSKQQQQSSQGEEAKRPGDVGFVPRARVPKPSTRDYVIRPKPEIEGQFRGETKSKQTSRFAKVQREIRKVTKRAVGVSINRAAL